MNSTKIPPLPKNEVKKAVDRKNPARVPLIRCRWWGEGLEEEYGAGLDRFSDYPDDAEFVLIDPLSEMDWVQKQEEQSQAHDAAGILADWKDLEKFVSALPDPDREDLFSDLKETAQKAHQEDRYLLFGWWRLFFERPWGLRGMENLLTDYYVNPEQVHHLQEILGDYYLKLLARAVCELNPDGFWTSDDLGHQKQLMMSPRHFREFIKPYYAEIGDFCRQHNLHFWLHSCGDNSAIVEDLIEVGVDIFHPVQKHTMDEKKTAEKYGSKLSFLAGFDVQHILQEGTPADVRREVRFLIDTFDGPDGGMCLAAGNGILPGTPLENIEAFLDEGLSYGRQHRKQF